MTDPSRTLAPVLGTQMFGKGRKEGVESGGHQRSQGSPRAGEHALDPGLLVQLDEREREPDGFGLSSGAVRPGQTGPYRLSCFGKRPRHNALLPRAKTYIFMILQTADGGTDVPNDPGPDVDLRRASRVVFHRLRNRTQPRP